MVSRTRFEGAPMISDPREDRQLLTAFVESRDQAAFEQIVKRYEGLVFSVCRRVLRDEEDVRDAAQAAFLVLAVKSGHLDGDKPLAPWLHHVAYQVSVDLLRSREARKVRERKVLEPAPRPVGDQPFRDELKSMLDQELDRLPEKYRQSLVMFHLEGRSIEETALALGRPVGTIGTWLSRGRDLLKSRLVRRGVTTGSVVAIFALIGRSAIAGSSDAGFASWTAGAAAAIVSGEASAGGYASLQVMALVRGASRLFGFGVAKTAGAAAGLAIAGLAGILCVWSPAENAAAEERVIERPLEELSAQEEREPTVAPSERIYRPSLALEASKAEIQGLYLTYVENVDCVACWADTGEKLKWSFTAPASGRYAVIVTSVHGHGPSRYSVRIGGQKVTGRIHGKGEDPQWYDYVDDVLESVELVEGKSYEACLQVDSMVRKFPMNFRRITLQPIESGEKTALLTTGR
jgi:RNA polymerase sigma factor (sigma-70 family)